MSSAAVLLMTCNVVAKKEEILRKRLKFTILFSKPDGNGLSSVHYVLISERRKYLLRVKNAFPIELSPSLP